MIHTLIEFMAMYCGAAVVGYGALVLSTRRLAHRAVAAPAGVPARLAPGKQAA